MGNKPLKPAMDPADLPHLTDAETLQRISVRFRQLSVPGPKGPHVTPASLMDHVSSSTSRVFAVVPSWPVLLLLSPCQSLALCS